jgi:hypothetical protein
MDAQFVFNPLHFLLPHISESLKTLDRHCSKTTTGHSLFNSPHCRISVPPNRSHELLTHIAFNLSIRSDVFTRYNGQEFIICKGDISLDVTFCLQHILQQSVKYSASVSRCSACGLPTEAGDSETNGRLWSQIVGGRGKSWQILLGSYWEYCRKGKH